MGWLHRVPGLDSAVPMLCPSYSGVPTGGLAQALPTWGLRKAEPGQAGNRAAQMPRNREFLDRRAEQWLPTCRWAYLDCAAHLLTGRWTLWKVCEAVGSRPAPCCAIIATLMPLVRVRQQSSSCFGLVPEVGISRHECTQKQILCRVQS